jgi:hypothetical protein
MTMLPVLQPGEGAEAPKTALLPVIPTTIGGTPAGGFGSNARPDKAVMADWCGGAWAEAIETLFVHGGGHSSRPIANVFALSVFALVLTLIFPTALAARGSFPTLAQNEWGSVPGTALLPTIPKTLLGPPPDTTPHSAVDGSYFGGNARHDKAIMSAWSGGAWAEAIDTLFVHGGGHADGVISNVFALPMSTLAWRVESPQASAYKLNDPRMGSNGLDTNPDGTPAAIHSWGGLGYLPQTNQLFRTRGDRWSNSGGPTSATWRWGPIGSGSWTVLTPAPEAAEALVLGWHAEYGVLIVQLSHWLWAFDPAANGGAGSWTAITREAGGFDNRGWGMMDTRHNRVYFFSHALWPGQVSVVDISRPWPVAVSVGQASTRHAMTGDIPPEWAINGYPMRVNGFYDPDRAVVVHWGGNRNWYLMDANFNWTKVTGAGVDPGDGISDRDGQQIRGHFGRVFYMRSRGLYAVVTDVQSNMFVYRPSGSTPPSSPPPSPPPTSITGKFLGVTGEDKVGPNNRTTGNGTPDWHIKVMGVATDAVSVRIDSFSGGVLQGRWVIPFNSGNWIIAKTFKADTLELWFEPYQTPASFDVVLNYANGTSATVSGISSGLSAPPPPRPPPPPPPPSPSGLLPLKPGWTKIDAPLRGFGVRGGKHQQWTKNPDNGRWYIGGGDYSNKDFNESYVQEQWSVDLAAWLAGNQNAGWRLEQPYCRTDGKVQPKHPDHVGWTWDEQHKKFVLLPGAMFGSNDVCPGETIQPVSDPLFIINRVMAFDPVTKDWEVWADTGNTQPNNWDWASVYDAPRKRHLHFMDDSNGNQGEWAYYPGADPKTTGQWKQVASNLQYARPQRHSRRMYLDYELLALDRVRWQVYVIDHSNRKFVRYDLATDTVEVLADPPAVQDQMGGTFNHCVFSQRYDVVFFLPVDPTVTTNTPTGLYAYHVSGPAAGTWETISLATGLGYDAIGRTMFYDEEGDALVLSGSLDDFRKDLVFFYRYSGTAY